MSVEGIETSSIDTFLPLRGLFTINKGNSAIVCKWS